MSSHERCPSCAQPLKPGDVQCRACGQALGEDNRCGRCHALAPSVDRGGRLECAACGVERPRLPGTVIISESDVLRAFEGRRWLPWGLAAGAAGSLLVGGSIAALVLAGSEGAFGRTFAAVIALLSLAVGGALAFFAQRSHRAAVRRRRFELEQRLVGLAYQHDGVLRAADVSAMLRIPHSEADDVLTQLAREGRVSIEVSDEGQISYVFSEAKRTRGIRVARASSPGADSTGRRQILKDPESH